MIDISQFAAQMISLYDNIDFISAYKNGSITIFENKIEEDLNMHALEFYCINALGEDSKDKDEIIVDYGNEGFLSFYQINSGNWLIIASNKQQFPSINAEVKKIINTNITFNLSTEEKLLPFQVEEEILAENIEERVNEKMLEAKKLQHSALPNLSVLGAYFSKYFSYYSPERVFSSDFYNLKETEESIYIMLADCAGESLNGALATVTINTILQQNLVRDPEQSLRSFYQDLSKSNALKGDGYSIGAEAAICRYDKRSGAITIATSGVPVLYIENENSYNLLKIKGTQSQNPKETKIETIDLYSNKGDKLIIYSDGLAKQLNEKQEKKLGNLGIREMFISMNGSFSGQLFEKDFSNWKGNAKQIDDITVIALEI